MSLTKEEFEKIDEAVRTIETILGEQSLTGCIALLAGIKAMGPETHAEIYKKLEEIEVGDD